MEKQTKQEIVYQFIRTRIFNYEYTSGTQLTEESLCEQLGVSRTPVREAIRRLISEGLLEITPGIGLSVPPIRLDDMIEIYEVREGLERLAVKLFMEKCRPESIDRLVTCLHHQETAFAKDDYVEFMQSDMQFHHVIYQGALNKRLNNAADAIYDQINRMAVSVQNDPELRKMAIADHRIICEAIINRDIASALKATEEHNQKVKLYHLKQYYNI